MAARYYNDFERNSQQKKTTMSDRAQNLSCHKWSKISQDEMSKWNLLERENGHSGSDLREFGVRAPSAAAG